MLRLRARKGTSLRSIFHSCEAERCLSLASFRFPWFKSPSESADSKSTVPATAKKPGRAVASRHEELPYPLAPRSAQFDFPIKVHEEYQADSVSRGQWYGKWFVLLFNLVELRLVIELFKTCNYCIDLEGDDVILNSDQESRT